MDSPRACHGNLSWELLGQIGQHHLSGKSAFLGGLEEAALHFDGECFGVFAGYFEQRGARIFVGFRSFETVHALNTGRRLRAGLFCLRTVAWVFWTAILTTVSAAAVSRM